MRYNASRTAAEDATYNASPGAPGDAVPGIVAGAGARDGTCAWCRGPLPPQVTRPRRWCSQLCRQAAWRLGRYVVRQVAAQRPGRFAYADPPYPGMARRYYERPEVDHRRLIHRLERGGYTGWALSTSSRALRAVLPLCPRGARVAAWVKPIGASPRTRGVHSTWEALIIVGGRQEPPGVRDWLLAQPARGGGQLPGRKPLLFCAWLFALLGMAPGDELVDLFPGTGVVGRAWREITRNRQGPALYSGGR